jgi:hypothetical protein
MTFMSPDSAESEHGASKLVRIQQSGQRSVAIRVSILLVDVPVQDVRRLKSLAP